MPMKVVLFYITVQAERARDIRARFDTFYSLITIAFCEQTPNPSEMKTRFVHVACLVLLIITLQYKQSPFCQAYWFHAVLTRISCRTMGAPEESQTVYDSTTSRAGPDIETLKKILLGLLCAVLLFILIFLIMNSWPTLVNYYRKVVPEDKKHVEKRTQTIRSWTISKVRTYPSVWTNKYPM